jgi:hypothetical protein
MATACSSGWLLLRSYLTFWATSIAQNRLRIAHNFVVPVSWHKPRCQVDPPTGLIGKTTGFVHCTRFSSQRQQTVIGYGIAIPKGLGWAKTKARASLLQIDRKNSSVFVREVHALFATATDPLHRLRAALAIKRPTFGPQFAVVDHRHLKNGIYFFLRASDIPEML